MRELIQALPPQIGAPALGSFTTVVHSETLESERLDIELGAVLASTESLTVTLPSDRVLLEGSKAQTVLGAYWVDHSDYGKDYSWHKNLASSPPSFFLDLSARRLCGAIRGGAT